MVVYIGGKWAGGPNGRAHYGRGLKWVRPIRPIFIWACFLLAQLDLLRATSQIGPK